MTSRLRNALGALTALSILFSADDANAICNLQTITSATPLTASTGTYIAPTAPAAQAFTLTIAGTYLSVLGGTCSGAIAFNRATLPASMAITGGGGATLPYTLQSAPGGGNTLLYTGGGVPGAANRLAFSFSAAVLGVLTPFSINVTAYALMSPGAPQQAGTYSDGITLDVIADILIIPVKMRSFAFTVTGDVAKVCTIGGVATPGADSATIPVAAGKVNTAPILKSYANAACNTPSNVQLTSQKGAVKTSASLVAGFSNLIDYTAQAAFGGANATLDTSTVPTAIGPESGANASTSGLTPSGTLSVTITPKSNTQPLLLGTYQDTLTITITPQ